MRVETPGGTIALGTVEAAPTIAIVDYTRRVTDAYGVTSVTERGFARRLTVRLAVPTAAIDAVQAQLAALRATAATWVADDRFASLSVYGYLKDFSLDLPGESTSYCSLTVESLVEPPAPAEGAGDPAPAGQVSSLRLVQPVDVTEAVLVATSIAEDEHPRWSADTIYAAGDRVIAAHRIFESAGAANRGDDPLAASGHWIEIGATNGWAMFDRALGSVTTAQGALEVVLDAGAADTVVLLDVAGAAVQVRAAGYDETQAVGEGALVFGGLPGGAVRVTVAGPAAVAVGTLLIGRLVPLGVTEAGAGAGITDYSRKVVDDFGEVTLVERAWAKRMTAKALIRTDALDLVVGRIAAVRARPSLWLGQSGVSSLTVYGFFKDFSVEVGAAVSKLSLSIEGLSKAAPLGNPNAAIEALDARLAQIRGEVDALASDGVITAGREKGRLVQDYLMLVNALEAVAARDGAIGTPADVADARDAASTARTALDQLLATYAPAWNDLTSDTVVDATLLRQTWLAADQAIAAYAAAITGRKGDPGEQGEPGDPGEPAPLIRTQWSIDGINGWHDVYFGADAWQRQSNDDGVTWGTPYRVIGESGDVGADGTSASIVFARAALQPDRPADNSGNPPAGWSDGPPAGTDYIWQSKATFRGAVQMTSWTEPARISGEDAHSFDVALAQVTLAADSNGVVKEGELPRGVPFSALVGTTDVTAATIVNLAATPGINAERVGSSVRFTAVTQDGAVTLSGTFPDGSALPAKKIAVTRQLDPAPPASATSATQTIICQTMGSTSYVDASGSRTIVLSAGEGGEAAVDFFVSYAALGDPRPRTLTMAAKGQYRAPGGTWFDAGPEVVGSTAIAPASELDDPPTRGEIMFHADLALTADATYEFRTIARKVSGTSTSARADGNLRVAQS